jgi:hypothetical protein
MKRLITCAALLLAAVAVFSAVGAQDEAVPSSAVDAQRQRLLEQLKTKVDLMSEEEVEAALRETHSEIVSLQAKRKLDEAAMILRTIVKEYEVTPAANVAGQMLAVHDRGPGVLFGDAPVYEPTPTRRAEPDFPPPAAPVRKK